VGVEGEVEGEGIAVMEGTVFASVSLLVPLFGLRRRLRRGKRRTEWNGRKRGSTIRQIVHLCCGPCCNTNRNYFEACA